MAHNLVSIYSGLWNSWRSYMQGLILTLFWLLLKSTETQATGHTWKKFSCIVYVNSGPQLLVPAPPKEHGKSNLLLFICLSSFLLEIHISCYWRSSSLVLKSTVKFKVELMTSLSLEILVYRTIFSLLRCPVLCPEQLLDYLSFHQKTVIATPLEP